LLALFQHLHIIEGSGRHREIVYLVAGGLAFAAPDAAGNVVEHAGAFRVTRKMRIDRSSRIKGEKGASGNAGGHPA